MNKLLRWNEKTPMAQDMLQSAEQRSSGRTHKTGRLSYIRTSTTKRGKYVREIAYRNHSETISNDGANH